MTPDRDHRPILVAHRGETTAGPENTLEAIEAAVRAGAAFVEVDVQMTADGVPILFHDVTLKRLTGLGDDVRDAKWAELRHVDLGDGVRVATVDQAVELLERWPDVTVFVEIKPASIDRFGAETTVSRVLDALGAIRDRAPIISFDVAALRLARDAGAAIGWVLSAYDETVRAEATQLAPEYLFCDHRKLPDGAPLWPGDWTWAIYEVIDASLAASLTARGADLVETMRYRAMTNAMNG